MTHLEPEDIAGMLCALAAYRIALSDLNFRPDESEEEHLRDLTLAWVSKVLGPKIVSHVDQIEADLRRKGEEKLRNRNAE